jgi:hypothetical protein
MAPANSLNNPAKNVLQTEQLMHVGMVIASKHDVLAKKKIIISAHICFFPLTIPGAA